MAKAFQEGDNYKLTQRRRLTRLQPTLQACRPSLFRIVIVMKSVRHTWQIWWQLSWQSVPDRGPGSGI